MLKSAFACIAGLLFLAGCVSSSKPSTEPVKESPKPEFRVYVTNENSGDGTVLDRATTLEVSSTIPVGKRPRGIRARIGSRLCRS